MGENVGTCRLKCKLKKKEYVFFLPLKSIVFAFKKYTFSFINEIAFKGDACFSVCLDNIYSALVVVSSWFA